MNAYRLIRLKIYQVSNLYRIKAKKNKIQPWELACQRNPENYDHGTIFTVILFKMWKLCIICDDFRIFYALKILKTLMPENCDMNKQMDEGMDKAIPMYPPNSPTPTPTTPLTWANDNDPLNCVIYDHKAGKCSLHSMLLWLAQMLVWNKNLQHIIKVCHC